MSAPNYTEIARRGAAAFRAQNPYDQGSDLWAAFEAGRMLGERRQQVPRRLTAAAARSLIANPPAAPAAGRHRRPSMKIIRSILHVLQEGGNADAVKLTLSRHQFSAVGGSLTAEIFGPSYTGDALDQRDLAVIAAIHEATAGASHLKFLVARRLEGWGWRVTAPGFGGETGYRAELAGDGFQSPVAFGQTEWAALLRCFLETLLVLQAKADRGVVAVPPALHASGCECSSCWQEMERG